MGVSEPKKVNKRGQRGKRLSQGKCAKLKFTRQESSMIHSARQQFRTAVKICFVLVDIEKWIRTDNLCEYSDYY